VRGFATDARAWASIEVKLIVLKRDASDPIRPDGLTVVVGDPSSLPGAAAPEVREPVLLVRPDRYAAAAFAVADAAAAARDFEALRAATWGELRLAKNNEGNARDDEILIGRVKGSAGDTRGDR
jgi:hypothetical protein